MTRSICWPLLVLLLLGALLLREGAREGGFVRRVDFEWFDFVAGHRKQTRYTKGPGVRHDRGD